MRGFTDPVEDAYRDLMSVTSAAESSGAKDAEDTPSKRQKIHNTNVDDVAISRQRQQALTSNPKSKRKQSNPRRLNLDTCVYDPPRN